MNKAMSNFFFPKINRFLLIRMFVTVVVLLVIGNYVYMPAVINGKSMEPTYSALGFNIVTRLKYKKQPIKVGDVVVIRYVDKKYFLKRVVALEGDVVEFIDGKLFVNGKLLDEPYLKNRKSDWNLERRVVDSGSIYAVGDNRTMDIDSHSFGQVPIYRVVGGVLW